MKLPSRHNRSDLFHVVAPAGVTGCVLLLVGCAHVPVQDLGDGRHSLSAVSKSGGYEGARAEAADAADEYCERSGQQAVIESFEDKPAADLEAEHSSAVIFSCGPSQSPRLETHGAPQEYHHGG
jgi:hypothetical protein